MKSWKTFVSGLVGSLGAYFITCPEPSWLPTVGKFMVGACPFLLGLFARDNDKTSEQVGIKS